MYLLFQFSTNWIDSINVVSIISTKKSNEFWVLNLVVIIYIRFLAMVDVKYY